MRSFIAYLLAAITLVLATGCAGQPQLAQLTEEGRSVGGLRGYEAVNRLIINRLLDPTDVNTASFDLSTFIGDQAPASSGLAVLLGGFSGRASANKFQSADPNGLNTLIWHLLVSSFAKEVGQSCSGDASHIHLTSATTLVRLNPEFTRKLKRVCSWPSAAAKDPSALLDIWTGVLDFDAPFVEYEAWTAFFTSPTGPFAATSAEATVTAMIRSMLLNSYFLLDH